MAEVRGSSPLSSTATVAPRRQSVGAHEFRNRFGFYLERAAAGDEISSVATVGLTRASCPLRSTRGPGADE